MNPSQQRDAEDGFRGFAKAMLEANGRPSRVAAFPAVRRGKLADGSSSTL
jgi:hypothetical protein